MAAPPRPGNVPNSERDAVLARYASDIVLIVDAEARVRYLSPSAERMMGYREEEWLGRSGLDVIHPDDVDFAAGAFARALATPGINEPLELRVHQVGQGWRWFEVVATNLLDHPAILGVVLCARDVTERIEAHEALRRQDERLNALLEHSTDVVVVVTPDGDLSYVSPSALHLLGHRHRARLGSQLMDFVHPDDRARVLAAFREQLRSRGSHLALEMRVAHADGTWRDIELVATDRIDDPAVGGIVGNLRDITDLRRAQVEVARNARRFEAILANLSDMASVIDADGNMSYVSPAAQRLVGRQADDRVGASIFDFVHPEDAPRALEELAQGVANRQRSTQFDARVLHEDGTYRTFEVRANNLLDDPAVNGIVVSSRDVTDRVTAERARHESERLYRTIVENANEGVWIIDENAVTTFANGRMAEMFGCATNAVIGRHIFDFLTDEGRVRAAANLERRRAGVGGQQDVELRRVDGSMFWAMASTAALIDPDGTYRGSIALVTDVTERRQHEADLRAAELRQHQQDAELDRRRLEAELNQTRRLESIGRLAAGVAHDFNNLVGVILNYAAAAARHLEPTSPAAADLAQIQHAAEQAGEVTRKLLTFGRADPLHPEVVDLNQLIIGVTQLVGRSFGQSIAIATRLAPSGCLVDADRGQMEQLLMNLLVNARDALPDGGTINVTTERVLSGSVSDAAPQVVVLTVADDGVGMSADVLERAFEPFFTTKIPERGTGLGLATVHSIVTRADGQVTIESEVGIGTTIRVRFAGSTSTAPP